MFHIVRKSYSPLPERALRGLLFEKGKLLIIAESVMNDTVIHIEWCLSDNRFASSSTNLSFLADIGRMDFVYIKNVDIREGRHENTNRIL